MRFAFKHAIATMVVIAVAVALAAVSYFALLAWAVAAGQGIGGPLAFPFVVLLALVTALLSVGCVLFPVTAAAELIACRALRWHRLAQIPVSAGLLVIWAAGLAVVVGLAGGSPIGNAARTGLLLVAALLVPLGLYWWCLQSIDLIVGLASRLLRRLLQQ